MAHKVKPGSFADSRRGSRHERGYGAAWDKLRARILKRDAGLCQCADCKHLGRIRVATQVDHIVNKAEWRRLHGSLVGVDAESNLQAINAECHRLKTQREAGRGGKKSEASSPSTDLEGLFSRAQVSGVGGVS